MDELQDFPGCAVVNTPPSNAEGADLIPRSVTKIPHATQPKDKNKIKNDQSFRNMRSPEHHNVVKAGKI